MAWGGWAVGSASDQPPHRVLLAGGPLTVTDANLCLGRLLPDYFPHIFGPGEDQPLSREAALQAFQELAARVRAFRGGAAPLSVEEVAMGFIRVANEAMCRPIRSLTQVGQRHSHRPPHPCLSPGVRHSDTAPAWPGYFKRGQGFLGLSFI